MMMKNSRERPFDHSLYTYILLLLLHFWILLFLLHAMPFPAIESNAFEYEKTSLFQIQKRVPPMKPSCNRIDRVQHTEFLFFFLCFFPFLDASIVEHCTCIPYLPVFGYLTNVPMLVCIQP